MLDSALAVPQSGFGDEYFHQDLFEMAAAYAFHIGEAQAFFDGNKRTAVNAALTFLAINGVFLEDSAFALYNAMIDIANHTMTKAQLATLLRSARRVT